MTNEQFQDLILAKLANMENSSRQQFQEIRQEVQEVKATINKLPTREELYQIVGEQQKDVIGLLNLSIAGTKRLEAKIDLIQQRIFENEADIQLLKKIK